MTVRLVSRADTLVSMDTAWVDVDTGRVGGGLAMNFEAAFRAIVPDLLDLSRTLGADPTAVLAHTPSAATNASDLGQMMAWSQLVEGWGCDGRDVLVVCRDPWLFRHLAGLAGVEAVPPPALPGRLSAWRGVAARLRFALGAAFAVWRMRGGSRAVHGGSWLLSYANPASRSDGTDAYFGTLMRDRADLRRVLHVDCPPDEVKRLNGDGRSFSLHAWGSWFHALTRLPLARWRPCGQVLGSRWGWLVRRAAAIEGRTGQAAAIAWQIHCQGRWLRTIRPAAVAWPWENHGWERDLARVARARGTITAGYQHSSVGRFEFNHHADSNPDGGASLPDQVLCTGPLTCDGLIGWKLPPHRCKVGGAFRFTLSGGPRQDAAAPLFVALPGDSVIAGQLVRAACSVAHKLGRKALIRPHPVYDIPVPEDEWVTRATTGLGGQAAVSAVIYAATTVGLEAVLFGLPTIRFIAAGCIAHDILPNTVNVPAADEAGLAAAIERAEPPPAIARDDVFAPVDHDVWRQALPLPKAAP